MHIDFSKLSYLSTPLKHVAMKIMYPSQILDQNSAKNIHVSNVRHILLATLLFDHH